MEFSITGGGGGGVYPFPITLLYKYILKDAQKLPIHPEM